MERYIRQKSVAATVIIGAVCVLLASTPVCAEPSKTQVISLWEKSLPQKRVLKTE